MVSKWTFPTGDLQLQGSGIPENRQYAITDVKNLPTYRGSPVFNAFRLATLHAKRQIAGTNPNNLFHDRQRVARWLLFPACQKTETRNIFLM